MSSFHVHPWHTPPTTARPSLSPLPSLASPLNHCPRKMKRKTLVRLDLCCPLVVISSLGLKRIPSWKPFEPPYVHHIKTSVPCICPKRRLEGNMINVAEHEQTGKYCDMLLLFTVMRPFPIFSLHISSFLLLLLPLISSVFTYPCLFLGLPLKFLSA